MRDLSPLFCARQRVLASARAKKRGLRSKGSTEARESAVRVRFLGFPKLILRLRARDSSRERDFVRVVFAIDFFFLLCIDRGFGGKTGSEREIEIRTMGGIESCVGDRGHAPWRFDQVYMRPLRYIVPARTCLLPVSGTVSTKNCGVESHVVAVGDGDGARN